MRILSIFIFCFLFGISPYAYAYDADGFGEDLNDSLQKEFFIEAKYFFLMRLYQNTDNALSNTMPHPFGILLEDGFDDGFDGRFDGVPEPLKRMAFRSFSRAIKAQFDGKSILSKIDAEPSVFESTFSGPALRFSFFRGHIRVGVRPDFDKGDFSSWKEFPIKPVAFINIGKGPLRGGVSYNPIEEVIRASLKFDAKERRIIFRQGIKIPLDNISEASTSADITYKVWEDKHIYLGGAFRTNIDGFDDTAGMIMLYGFW